MGAELEGAGVGHTGLRQTGPQPIISWEGPPPLQGLWRGVSGKLPARRALLSACARR